MIRHPRLADLSDGSGLCDDLNRIQFVKRTVAYTVPKVVAACSPPITAFTQVKDSLIKG
jgi:hypothetical protein